MQRLTAYSLVAAAAVLPRLIVVSTQRSDLVLDPALIDRNAFFARTFADSGTFGFVAGLPSAGTQPLYGFFLIPLYWLFDGSWLSIGLAQTLVALATALLVYEIARRTLPSGWALAGAIVATWIPYLVWHDVHVAREVLDGLAAAGLVLLTMLAVSRRSTWLAAAAGLVAGIAVLGNVRLVALPIVLGLFVCLSWSTGRRGAVAATAIICASAVVLLPWAIRNKMQVGCFTLNTNAQALWKANNLSTEPTLAAGKWIDDVPLLRAPVVYRTYDDRRVIDECAEMRFYRARVFDFWQEHPGAKARLAARATLMLWDPRARTYEIRTSTGGKRTISRPAELAATWVQGLFMTAVFGLALVGVFAASRNFVALALVLLGYQTVAAMVFAGTTRYRAPWDFLLVLLAAAGAKATWVWFEGRGRAAPTAADAGAIEKAL